MTAYTKPSILMTMESVDPLAPNITKYYDMSQAGVQPGLGGPILAQYVYYDNSNSGLATNNVQGAIDLLKDQVDHIIIPTISPASESVAGIAELATQDEVNTGTDDLRIVTPLKMVTYFAAHAATLATEAAPGLIRIATVADVTAGTVDNAAVTPLKLAPYVATIDVNSANIAALQTAVTALNNGQTTQDNRLTALEGKTGPATESAAGIAEIATSAEVTSGTDDVRIVTPLKLAQKLAAYTVNAATETAAGIAEIATQAEVTTGTDDSRIVTPLKLAQKLAASGYVLKAGDTMTGPLFINYGGAATGFDNTRDIHIKNEFPGRQASILIENTAVSWHARMTFKNTIRSWTMGITQSGQAPFQIIDLTAAGAPVRMAIDENGNVGVGAAPQSGTIKTYITNPADHTGVRIEAGGTAKWAQLFLKNSVREYGFNTDNNGAFILFDNTAGAPRLSIDTSANAILSASLGVRGPVNPGVFLQVNGTGTAMMALVSSGTAQSLNLHLQDAGYHWEILKHTDNSFRIVDDNAGAYRFSIDTNGKTGIGVTPAQTKLHVYDPGFAELRVQTGTNYWTRLGLMNTLRHWTVNNNPSGQFIVQDETLGAIRFSINGNTGEAGICAQPQANVTLSVGPLGGTSMVYIGDPTNTTWADVRLQNTLRHWALQCMGSGNPGAYRIHDATVGKDRLLIDTNGVLHLKAGSAIVYDLAA